MIPVLLYPGFDPVMLRFGPFAIRWYALAYILGLVVGWRLLRRLVGQAPRVASREQVDDFLSWATLGVVLGMRHLERSASSVTLRLLVRTIVTSIHNRLIALSGG